jgi:hypothetical protein
MNQEQALKVVMVLVGLLFAAAIYPSLPSSSNANSQTGCRSKSSSRRSRICLGIRIAALASSPPREQRANVPR